MNAKLERFAANKKSVCIMERDSSIEQAITERVPFVQRDKRQY
jgi:hypothetical protein